MYSRTQNDSTKQKISQKMKQVHAQRSPEEKVQIAKKQSDSMKRIWANIPQHISMDDYLNVNDE